jgi:hypothetical protein
VVGGKPRRGDRHPWCCDRADLRRWPNAVLATLLFGIEPLDPVSFAGATLALLTAAALASYPPAHRAATIDPLTALRHD